MIFNDVEESKKTVKKILFVSLFFLILFLLMPSENTFKKFESIELAKIENNLSTQRSDTVIKLLKEMSK